MDITFINLTPHSIAVRDVNNAITVFPASGTIARVGTSWEQGTDVGAFASFTVTYTTIEGLPSIAGDGDEMYIVSAMVLEAAKAVSHPLLKSLIAPATGHANVSRNDKGHILSVPGFVRA